MAPSSPTFAKRMDPRNVAVFLITLALAAALCYNVLERTPAARDYRAPNRFRVRLNINTGAGPASVVDVEGGEERVRAAVAAALSIDEGAEQRPGSQPAGQTAQQQQAQQQEEEQQRGKQQAPRQQQQQQQLLAADRQGSRQSGVEAAKLPPPPAKSDEQRFAEFAEAVGKCLDGTAFECLTRQADMDPGPGQFRFPHFMVVGFQKCATTSLFHHLADHPRINEPDIKEPEFFTNACEFNAMRCKVSQQRDYMEKILRFKEAAASNFTTASFEGSTHYVLESRWLAGQLRDLFPWLKIVVSMREPISQAIAMVFHNLDKGRNPRCYENNRVFQCIHDDLDVEARYSRSLLPWLAKFPREQLHVIQYENITADPHMVPALREIKSFLGVNPKLPYDELGLYNYRHQRKHTQGWRMTREEYLKLVDKARRNAQEVVDIVRQHGFADPAAWLKNWEDAWQENLEENCEPGMQGTCMIQVT
ncbi:hypothetical protein ABPG75_004528 [Micractinium tetrahymenae]